MKKSIRILFFIFICLLLNACNIVKHRINFTTLEEMEPVLSGKGVPHAADYDPESETMPSMVILDVNGTYNEWNDDLPEDWHPKNVEDVELIIVIEEKVECVDVVQPDRINTFDYHYFYRHDLFVKVYEAFTGNILKVMILEGPEPTDPFQMHQEGNRTDYDPVSFDLLKYWLENNSTGLFDSLQVMWHNDGINSVAYSPDGQMLASGSDSSIDGDKTLCIWNVENGTLMNTLDLDSLVYSLAFSPDGKTLASGTVDGRVFIWGVDDVMALHTLPNYHGWPVYDVTFSPNGEWLATASHEVSYGDTEGAVKLWRVDDGSLIGNFESYDDARVESVDFSPDGELIAICTNDQIRICNVDDDTQKTIIEQDYVQSAVFSPDGQIIASVSFDDNVYLWQVETGALLATFEGHENSIEQLAFSPNGEILASASIDHTVRLWDLEDGTVIHTLELCEWVTSVAFSPQGDSLATGLNNGLVLIWELDQWIED